MFALPPAAQQSGLEEQPAGSTPDTPTDRPCDPRSLQHYEMFSKQI